MRITRTTTSKFSVLLHEGNQPGFTKEIAHSKLDANLAKRRLTNELTREQQNAGWWYEVREEAPEMAEHHPRGRTGREPRRNIYRG